MGIKLLIKKFRLSLGAISKISNWWDYFLDYLNLKKGFIIYKVGNKRIKIRAGTSDKECITELILEKRYLPNWLKLTNNSTVIDLGAHIGVFSTLLNCKVYAIEPNNENFRLLLENIRLNHSNVIPRNLALSNKKGKVKLWDGRHSARNSLVRIESRSYEVVNTMTLQDFFKKEKIKKCDLLKMDIEGGEYDVLYPAPRKIFDKINAIILELHKIEGQNQTDLIKFLKDKGFVISLKENCFIYARKIK